MRHRGRTWVATATAVLATWSVLASAGPATAATPKYCLAVYNFGTATTVLQSTSLAGLISSNSEGRRLTDGLQKAWAKRVYQAIYTDTDADAVKLAEAFALFTGVKKGSTAKARAAFGTMDAILQRKCGDNPYTEAGKYSYPW